MKCANFTALILVLTGCWLCFGQEVANNSPNVTSTNSTGSSANNTAGNNTSSDSNDAALNPGNNANATGPVIVDNKNSTDGNTTFNSTVVNPIAPPDTSFDNSTMSNVTTPSPSSSASFMVENGRYLPMKILVIVICIFRLSL